MTFGTRGTLSRYPKHEITVGNNTIKHVPTYKYLGITLDSQLTFNKHVQVLSKSISHKSYMLNRYRKRLTEHAAADVVTKMICPVFDYGDIIYGAAGKTKLDDLQVHQNKCLRICNREPPLLNRVQLHQKYKVLPLNLKRELHMTKFAFKRSLLPEFVDDRQIHTRAHDSRLLKTFFTRRTKVQGSVEYRCAALWNSLETKQRETFEGVKFSNGMRSKYDLLLKNLVSI